MKIVRGIQCLLCTDVEIGSGDNVEWQQKMKIGGMLKIILSEKSFFVVLKICSVIRFVQGIRKEAFMNKIKLRICCVPMETALYVAEDGMNYSLALSERRVPEYDDKFYDAKVIPGVSKIKVINVSDGVDHNFWTYSNETEFDGAVIGEGNDLNSCIISVPGEAKDGTTLYIEEDSVESEYGYDHRDLFFKSEKDEFPLTAGMFELFHEAM